MLASAPVVCLILSASYIYLIVFPFILTKGPCAFDILLLAFAAALTPLCLTTALRSRISSHGYARSWCKYDIPLVGTYS